MESTNPQRPTPETTTDDQAASGKRSPDKPTIRQLIHWATGDRDAEAKALADAAEGPVSRDEAKRAVQAAHGDIPSDKAPDDSEVAKPADLESRPPTN